MRGPDKHEDIVAIVDPPRAGLRKSTCLFINLFQDNFHSRIYLFIWTNDLPACSLWSPQDSYVFTEFKMKNLHDCVMNVKY